MSERSRLADAPGPGEAPETGGTTSCGLPPRPVPDPAVLALVATAYDQLVRPVVVATEPSPPGHTAWRFSGRWWHRPVPARRDRPFRSC